MGVRLAGAVPPQWWKSGPLMPRVAQHELQVGVQPGIVITDRCIRQVIGLHHYVPGVLPLAKDLRPNFRSTGEVDLRGITRRQVAVAEERAAHRREVRSNFAAAGEVPLEDDRVDAPGVLCAFDPVLVEGDEVDGHFVGPAQNPRTMFAGQDTAQAKAEHKILSAGGGGNRGAAAAEDAFVPAGMAQDIDGTIGGNLSEQRRAYQATEQSKRDSFLHCVFRVMAKVIRLGASVQTRAERKSARAAGE